MNSIAPCILLMLMVATFLFPRGTDVEMQYSSGTCIIDAHIDCVQTACGDKLCAAVSGWFADTHECMHTQTSRVLTETRASVCARQRIGSVNPAHQTPNPHSVHHVCADTGEVFSWGKGYLTSVPVCLPACLCVCVATALS